MCVCKKYLVAPSLIGALGVAAPSASGIVLVEDRYDDVTFATYNNQGPSSAGVATGVTSPPAPADRIFSGEQSFRMTNIDDNIFGGSSHLAELFIGGGLDASTDEERDVTQFDNPDGTSFGMAYLRFYYRVVRLQEHILDGDAQDQPDVNGVQGIPDASITDLPEYPGVTVSFRFFDPGFGNKTIAQAQKIDLINNNQWTEAVLPVSVLNASQRAALNEGGVNDPNVIEVLNISLPNLGNLEVLSKVTADIFFDKFELFAEDPREVAVPGDADGDGDVDAFDLGIWQTQFGQTGPDLSADFDEDGDVDAFDLGLWQTNFGTGVEAATVPEPAMLALVLPGLLAIGRRRRA